MLYPKDTAIAVIKVLARLSKHSKITKFGLACQVLAIEIHCKETITGIILGQEAFITMILKQFNMQNVNGVSTQMDPIMELHLAEDQGEKELKHNKSYLAIVGSLMYVALATRPHSSFTAAALCQFNSCPFTSHLTTATRDLQYLESTADFRLHFSNGSNDQLTRYMDSD